MMKIKIFIFFLSLPILVAFAQEPPPAPPPVDTIPTVASMHIDSTVAINIHATRISSEQVCELLKDEALIFKDGLLAKDLPHDSGLVIFRSHGNWYQFFIGYYPSGARFQIVDLYPQKAIAVFGERGSYGRQNRYFEYHFALYLLDKNVWKVFDTLTGISDEAWSIDSKHHVDYTDICVQEVTVNDHYFHVLPPSTKGSSFRGVKKESPDCKTYFPPGDYSFWDGKVTKVPNYHGKQKKK
jgi:hypothetical protein